MCSFVKIIIYVFKNLCLAKFRLEVFVKMVFCWEIGSLTQWD